MKKLPLWLAYSLVALFLVACTAMPQPLTFNGSVLAADGLAALLGKTCLQLSQRDRIPVDTLVRCTATVEQAGTLIDTARTAGAGAGQDRLAAAQALLLALETELKAREAR